MRYALKEHQPFLEHPFQGIFNKKVQFQRLKKG
jgi:hypothetical protein